MHDQPRLTPVKRLHPEPPPKRWLWVAAGAALVGHGLRQGGASGLLQAAAGAWAGWHGYRSGESPVKEVLASPVVARSITLNRPLEEVIGFCRNPANIGELLSWVDTIEEVGPATYRWAVRGPGERTLHWRVEQYEPELGHVLNWRTPAASPWPMDISARFTGVRHGTQIKVLLSAQGLSGPAGQALGQRLGRFADQALLQLLQHIRQRLETGEARLEDADAHDFLFVHPASQ